HCLRIENALADDFKLIAIQAAIETASVSFVARRLADLVNLEKNGVGIAIDENLADVLNMPALLPFAPEPPAAAAEIAGTAGANCLVKSFPVHPREHQHLAGARVLGNRGHQSARLFEIDWYVHGATRSEKQLSIESN